MVPVGAVLPLAGFTVAVSVTGEFWAMLEADAARDVVVLITPGLGLTVRLNVALCTRSPLIAHSVTGTVRATEVEDAVRTSVDEPLVRLGVLKEPVTPVGKPETLRFTLP
jgi:hypothetical protein